MKKLSNDRSHAKLLEEKNREILRLRKEVAKWKKRATLDPMTGVKNKKEGLRILDNEIKKIISKDKALTVCFVDVDGLKKINDQLGHCEGDQLLISVSRLISENIRKHDEIFRFGGDEFIIIFPNATEIEAQLIWKRIVERIDKFNHQMKLKCSIKLSVGFVEYKKNKKLTVTDLISAADQEMYKEKYKNLIKL